MNHNHKSQRGGSGYRR